MSRDLAKAFAAIGQPRILVVGDLILDRYVWGSVERISPEAPIPILKVAADDPRPGGAGCVAVNLAALGARVAVAGTLGKDDAAQTVRRLLRAHEIDVQAILAIPDRPTTAKTRFIARVQQLLRTDREDPTPLPEKVTTKLLARLEPKVRKADIVLVSDYNKGLLTPAFLEALIKLCRKTRKRVVVDPARGVDPVHYRGATAICPNRTEAAEAAGLPNDPASLDKIGRRLVRRLDLEASIITRDRDGISLYRKGAKPLHIATRAREVFDVTGAGDMVLSILGFVLAGGASLSDAVEIANVAAGLEVARLGAEPLSREEIISELEPSDYSLVPKLRNRKDLTLIVRNLQSGGRSVIFTNGCFDLLNANHVSLFRYAKSLGDVLIVATNSDASIRRLKGPTRPTLPERDRIPLLSAIEHIDYIAVFPEDTPCELLRLLKPDVLVKGGDYKSKEDVVGWEIVESYGGRIERAPLAEHYSTTGIVQKMLDAHKHSS